METELKTKLLEENMNIRLEIENAMRELTETKLQFTNLLNENVELKQKIEELRQEYQRVILLRLEEYKALRIE